MSRPRSPGGVYKRTTNWWIWYWHGEKHVRESAESPKRQVALDLLKKRLGELGAGTLVGLEARRLTFDDLAAIIENDYVANGRRSLDTLKHTLKHLRQHFGSTPVPRITRDGVDAYVAARLQSGMARATVQKELSALARMFTLAVRSGRITTRPYIARLRLRNTRAASFSEPELAALLDVIGNGRPASKIDCEVKAQPDLVPPIVFAAVTGWRMKSEVLKLTWRQVDFTAGTVSLAINTTKSGEPRVFPFGVVPRLAQMLREQRERTTVLERATGNMIPLVFHRRGQPIRNIHMAWTAACRRAGLAGRVPHDLRRTAARALRGLGMSDRDIAEACGWETIEMVTRYLGRDPSGIAERLRARVAEASSSTVYAHEARSKSEL